MAGRNDADRDLAAAEIDAQYNMRAAVPSFQSHIDRWISLSRLARESLVAQLDVAYGGGATDRLDIFTPHGARGPFPVQIFFHGGYWRALGKADFSFVAGQLAPAGMMVVVVDYALCPSVTMDELVAQCRRAVQWIGQNIDRYGGDPDRLHLSGHSAGGHIVAMVDATDWAAFSAGLAPRIRGLCAVSGLFDLEPLRRSFLQPDLRLDDGQIARNSPIHLSVASAAARLLAVGEFETREFHRQSERFAGVKRKAGANCETLVVPGVHHYSILEALGAEGSALRSAMLRQMGL